MAEEQRALLGADGGDGSPGSPGPPRALPAACDPRRLPHRLLVLALMCFLGFGAGRARVGGVGVRRPGQSPEASPSPRRQLLLLRQPGRSADAGPEGGVTCLFSLSCALILAYLDRRAERLLCKEQGRTGEVIKLTDVKDFSLSLWLIFVICVCYYAAVFPFIGLGKVFFIEKFQFSPQEASAINSIVYIISAPMSPVFGLLVDKVGKNIIWVLCAVVTTLASHIMLAFTFWNPWIAMCLLGVAYSLLACALWPMVAFVVPEHQLGTAYGFMQSIQNLGLAVIAIAAGMILDTRGYLFLEVFFSACVCLSLLAVVMLYFVNHLTGGDLNWSARKRAKLQKAAASEAEEQQRLRRQNEDDLAKLLPKADAFSLRNKYLSKLGAQLPAHYSSCFSTLAHRSVLK
ncbi:major facilitator superfamily domain-containing protein 1 isoform X9 [Serinus canaria]|uniref:major facilitator superfamily domain-containing protein 1 isoform X9 n=1 Tax=Serinus canaria TaxID=9135 RepID=UPI0021CC6E65|nr:major facilitator superfamily domain-containing protein 1 isoform X9 [Serinus canaria]